MAKETLSQGLSISQGKLELELANWNMAVESFPK